MKILVIRFSSLGDVVLITPLFQKIRDIYPNCQLTFVTDSRYIDLFRSDPNIDRIIPYNVSDENLIYLIRFLKKIREEYYNIIIDCHIIPRSVFLLLFGRTSRRSWINKFSFQRRRMIKSHNSKRIPHIVDRYLATIDGNLNDRYEPKIYLEKRELRRIEGLLRKRKGGKRVVGFVPGASKKTKMWEIEKIKELALQLVEKNNAFIVFLGDMNEITIAKDTKEILGDTCLDLTGKTSIRELALALQCCDVLFTTDSGPMHIAVSVGTPIVSIFGPTVQEFGFRPYDERSVIISKSLPCRPCSLHGTDKCPLGHHNCMKLIEVEEVRKEIEKLLYSSEGRREMRDEDNRLKT